MSYQVLARKWRPQQFGDMIGQEHVLKALVNALESNRLHHAYLFTGMRGVGKTTIARIFAKCLNCERVETVTANPCGECPTCLDIEAGRFFDLIEVDAASRTKVDETRELLENVPYAPTSGRYKVYLIDEVHMFSNHSFNALLKTLEEPPAHVKFLLATTDPQKVPVTVLSRCLQFNLKRMIPARLADYLEKILSEESIANERGALDLIARAADGSVRDSLSLVEQAAAYGDGEVKLDEVESMLGRVSVSRLLDLIESLANHDVNQLFSRINELAQYAPDYHLLLGEILSLTHRIALLQSVPNSVEPDATELEQLQALADTISAEDIQLWYQIGMHARRDMPFAPDPREAFDMAMLRMLAFAPQADGGGSVIQGGAAPVANNASTSNAVTGNAATTNAATTNGAATSVANKPAEANPNMGASTVGASTAPMPAAETSPTLKPAPAPKPIPTPKPAPESEANVESAVAPAVAPAVGDMSSSADRLAALNAALGREPATKKKLNETQPNKPVITDAQPASPIAAQDPSPESVDESIEETAEDSAEDSAELESHNTNSPEPEEKLELESEHWPSIVRAMGIDGLPLQLAMHSAIKGFDKGVLTLLLPKPAQHLKKPQVVEQLAVVLTGYHQSPVKLSMEVTSELLVTPASLKEAAARKAQQDAEDSIENDPLLAVLLSRVDGEVTKNSVRPLQAQAETTADNGENS